MRKWGLVITFCYALILLVLLLPMAVALVGSHLSPSYLWQGIMEACHQWRVWIPLGIFLSGQALLLFLSVDTSFRRLQPRAHILVSCTVAALLLAVLTAAGIWSFGSGISGDEFGDTYFSTERNVWGFCFVLWLLWGILFYFYFRDSSAIVTRLLSWLLKGSVLDLLIAVPCHIIVRRRHDCSAPIVTSFGIASGLAIMLLTFGPSVLFLYKKRLDSYPPRPSA
jgi:hypothetical protein